MIFIINEAVHEKHGSNLLSGSRKNILLSILESPDSDVTVLEDDYSAMTSTFKYLGLDYKYIVGAPDTINSTAALFKEDDQHLISFDSYRKIVPYSIGIEGDPKVAEFVDKLVEVGDEDRPVSDQE